MRKERGPSLFSSGIKGNETILLEEISFARLSFMADLRVKDVGRNLSF